MHLYGGPVNISTEEKSKFHVGKSRVFKKNVTQDVKPTTNVSPTYIVTHNSALE